MRKLNLGEILKTAPHHVIMRMSKEFPDYTPGSDVDILCEDIYAMVGYLKAYFEFTMGYELVQFEVDRDHIQLDYYQKRLDLKFDLYQNHISEQFSIDTLRDYDMFQIDNHFFKVPYFPHENILKAYEWFEHKKIKYNDYAKFEELLNEYYATE